MRRVVVLFVLLLFIPQPMTQLLVKSMVKPSINTDEKNFSLEYNPETDYVLEDRIIRITPITEDEYKESLSKDSSTVPHLAPAIYPSLTEVTGSSSILHRGDLLSASATTEYELLGYVPVDRGYHYWYDLQDVVSDNDNFVSTISVSKIAIEFSSTIDCNVMAFSFNLSQISTPISNSIKFYLTDNLNNYLTDYMMYSEISLHSYNSQKSNLDSPLLFTFWNHPLTTPISNALTADTPYFVVLESTTTFMLQTSSDLTGSDDNNVYTFESSSWVEQSNIDIDLGVYTGSLIQSSSLGASGTSNLSYDSTYTSGVNHKLVVNYYDSSLMYDSSSDFLDLIILDSFNPEYVYLSSPPTAEYGDEIELTARVENSYHQPLQDELVSFYVSDDNQTWSLIGQTNSLENGYAIESYNIPAASGTKYFKVTLDLLAAYSSTQMKKETIFIETPQINCMYGSAVGAYNLAPFQLYTRVYDNEGNPVVNQMVIFFMQGALDPIFAYTNQTGWAITANGYINWNSGFYSNSYWISLSMDSNLFIYPSTSYGDIYIQKNDLTITSNQSLQSIWNEAFEIPLGFFDAENDAVPNLNHEIIIYNNKTGKNTSLGLYQTDTNGENTIAFSEAFFNPGEYLIIVKVNNQNYASIEKIIPLTINSDQASISVNINSNETYSYGSTLHLEAVVVDHFGNPLENILVYVHVSIANYIDFWDDIHILSTNSSGYVKLDIILNMEVGDILNILINTADYFVGDILYYEGADSIVSYFTCVPTETSFEQLDDLNCTNQETIIISGRLMSNGNPLSTQAVRITILDEYFIVVTDASGYFSLEYLVKQGGDIVILIEFEGTDNYLPTSKTTLLYSKASIINLTGDDIYHTTADPVTFAIYLDTPYGTTPEGVVVDIYWFDGSNWIYLDTIYSDANGYATYVSGIVFPLGNFLWKARIANSADWLESEGIYVLQIGIETLITIYSPSSVEYEESVTLTAYVTDEYGDPIVIQVFFYVDGILIGSSTTNANGYATVEWQVNIAPGNYQLAVHVLNSGMYLASSSSTTIGIQKTASYLSCDDEFIFYSETANLGIQLYSASSNISTSYINVNITGLIDEQVLTNANGLALWFIPLLEPGVYTVRIVFAGNSLYYSTQLFITLQIDKMPTTINYQANNQYYVPIYEISGYVEDTFNQPIEGVELILKVGGEIIDTTVSDIFGHFEFQVNLQPGMYNIEISYEGDNHFLSSSFQKIVYIWQIDTSTHVNVIWEEQDLTVEALLLDHQGQPIANQLIFFYLDGVYIDHIVTNSTGYAELVMGGIIPGTYELIVTFGGTTIYSGSSKTVVIDQDKLQTEMSVTITEGIYGTTATTIEIHLTSEGNPLVGKNIELIINGEEYAGITNSSGYLLISLNLFTAAGHYTVTIDFYGDEIYTAVNISTSFDIAKAESQITLHFSYVDYLPVLSGSLLTPAILVGASLQIYNGLDYLETVLTNSLGNFDFSLLLPAGIYQLEVRYVGDSNHFGSMKNIQIEIYKSTLQIYTPPCFNQTYGEETYFDIYVEDVLGYPLSITLIVKLDGVYYSTIVTNINGNGTLILTSDMETGIHLITFEFQGNDNYYQTTKNMKIYTKFEVVLDDFQTIPDAYGDEGQITGTIDTYSGELPIVSIKMSFNGEIFTTTIDPEGNFIFVIDSYLPAGTYQAILSVEETDKVLSFEYTFGITRTKGQATITIDTNQRIFNDDNDIEGYVLFEGTGLAGVNVIIYIDGLEVTSVITDENGKFVIPKDWLEYVPGDYILTLTALIADANIDVTTAEFSLEIQKDVVNVDISYDNTKVEQELLLNIILSDSQSKLLYYYSLNLEINGSVYQLTTDEYGETSFTLPLIEVGSLYILISGSETAYYSGFSFAFEISIEKTLTQVSIEESQIPFNHSEGLAIKLESEFGNALEGQALLVVINSTTFNTITDENGTVFIDISNFSLGNHSVFINFDGTENYQGVSLFAEIKIIPQGTQFVIIYENKQAYLQLLDSEGRPLFLRDVTFKYLDSNDDVITTEIFKTDLEGLIVLDISSTAAMKEAKELYVVYEGERCYTACDIWLSISELLLKLQQSLEDPTLGVYVAVGLAGIAAIFGFRHFLKKRKI